MSITQIGIVAIVVGIIAYFAIRSHKHNVINTLDYLYYSDVEGEEIERI